MALRGPGCGSRTRPLPPEPGCYVALASGPSHTRFHIALTGASRKAVGDESLDSQTNGGGGGRFFVLPSTLSWRSSPLADATRALHDFRGGAKSYVTARNSTVGRLDTP